MSATPADPPADISALLSATHSAATSAATPTLPSSPHLPSPGPPRPPGPAGPAASSPDLPFGPLTGASRIPPRPPPTHVLSTTQFYTALEAIQHDLKSWSSSQGFAVVRSGLSNYAIGKPCHITYACAKRRVRQTMKQTRQTATYKTGCRWTARATCLKKNGYLWNFYVPENACHNHNPVLDPTALAPLRGLSDDAKRLIRSLTVVPTIKIREVVRIVHAQFPDMNFIAKDVENYRQKMRREKLLQSSPSSQPVQPVQLVQSVPSVPPDQVVQATQPGHTVPPEQSAV